MLGLGPCGVANRGGRQQASCRGAPAENASPCFRAHCRYTAICAPVCSRGPAGPLVGPSRSRSRAICGYAKAAGPIASEHAPPLELLRRALVRQPKSTLSSPRSSPPQPPSPRRPPPHYGRIFWALMNGVSAVISTWGKILPIEVGVKFST